MSSQDERRLAAIMFTDIVGYTALAQKDEPRALALLEAHKSLIRVAISKHRGREVKTMGDGALIEFGSALEATESAVEIQRALHDSSKANSEVAQVRIGVHVGDVVHRDGDVFGDAVNIASRIEPLAEAGGICISEQVYDQVRNKVPYALSKLGSRALKNVGFLIDVYKVELPWQASGLSTAMAQDRNRVAILPLVNMTNDPNDEYFADGMTEEMISTLSNISGLVVISRTSTMQYKGAKKNLVDIGRELGAGTILEGSVRKAGNRVRITVQLLDAPEDKHLWSSSYDRDLQDVFAVQSDIAERVAEALRVRLLPNERQAIEKKPTASKEAHMLYLKGRYHWNERTPKSSRLAAEYFEKAIGEDPSFALAYVGLSDSYTIMSDQGVMKPLEAGQKIKALAEKALELDPTLAEAHASLANVLSYVFWDWRRAELEYKRSIELNPAYPTARQWYGKHLSFVGRYDEALEQHRQALQLDPFSLIINTNYAEALVEAGKYSEGIEQANKTVALDPNFLIGHFEFGMFYLGGQELEKAEQEFKRSLEILPGFAAAIGLLGFTYGTMGRKEECLRMLSDLKGIAAKGYVPPAEIAIAEFGLGLEEEAFKHLEEAYDERSSWLLYFKAFPAFARLKSDPRFTRILARMGLGGS